MVNRIEEKRVNYNYERNAGTSVPKKKTLIEIMKNGRSEANRAKHAAAETQEFLKWALQNCKTQGDLDAIRELINTHGTAKQRKAFEKMEHNFTSELTNSQRRQELAARSTDAKVTRNENFRQAILNAESVDDLKALEKEYDKNFPQSLRTTYNSRLSVLEEAAKEAEALHTEKQNFYNKMFSYGNGKHPSVTQLGNAKPSATSDMTWAKYAQEHGTNYTKPISGVAEADRIAEEIIKRNTVKPMEMTPEARAIYERIDEQLHKRTPVKPYEYPLSGKSAAESADAFDPMTPEARAIYEKVDKQLHKRTPVKPYEYPLSGKSAKESAAIFKEHFGTKNRLRLGKKGKFALAALTIGAIGTGIAYLMSSKKAQSTTPNSEKVKSDLIPADSTAAGKVDTTDVKPIIIQDSIQTAPKDSIEQQVMDEIPFNKGTGKHIVKKGDNCWNIAKAELIKENDGKVPSDKEVLKRTYKILERNDLNFEADKYTVLIYPKDTLDVRM